MSKVFVTNYNPDFSYDDAENIGELIYMTEGFVPPAHYASAQKKFAAFAASASSDDVLLLSGANVLVAVAVSEWLGVHDTVTVLQHTKKRGESGRLESSYTTFTLRR